MDGSSLRASMACGRRVVDEDRLIILISQLLAVDVMVDAIGKQRKGSRDDRRRIIQTKVELPAVLWLQTGISQFVSLGSLVHAIRRQFADVWSTESSCQVQLQIEIGQNFISQSDASGYSFKAALKGLEAERIRLAVQMAMIVSDAAAQVQFAYLLAHRGKYTKSKR